MLEEFKLIYDPSGDPYGACMGAWFDICAVLDHRGDTIPDAWQYRAPMVSPSLNECTHDWEGHSSADLIEFADTYLARLRKICDARDWSY